MKFWSIHFKHDYLLISWIPRKKHWRLLEGTKSPSPISSSVQAWHLSHNLLMPCPLCSCALKSQLLVSCLKFFASLSGRHLLLFEDQSSWQHQQVWIKAMWSSFVLKQTWFVHRFRKQHWPFVSMSNRICRPILLSMEFQARLILTKRSLLVF